MKHSRPERLGQKKGCGFPGSRERQLYCIFIQPVECSLDFADSRADPENSSFSAQSVSAGTRRLPRSCSSCWPSNAMDLALCAARRAAANGSSGQTRLRAVRLSRSGWGRVAGAEVRLQGPVPPFSRPVSQPGSISACRTQFGWVFG